MQFIIALQHLSQITPKSEERTQKKSPSFLMAGASAFAEQNNWPKSN
jgi:hypothetical protein